MTIEEMDAKVDAEGEGALNPLSMRGQYLIGRALNMAVEILNEVEEPHREISDISDMNWLGEHIFVLGWSVEKLKREDYHALAEGLVEVSFEGNIEDEEE